MASVADFKEAHHPQSWERLKASIRQPSVGLLLRSPLKNLPRQRLHIFRNRKGVDRSAWKINPAGYADDEIVIQQWDEILRMIATIKLKEVTASDLFRRLNSYSRQHALCRALKAFGQIP
jgi:TnpA family transposase